MGTRYPLPGAWPSSRETTPASSCEASDNPEYSSPQTSSSLSSTDEEVNPRSSSHHSSLDEESSTIILQSPNRSSMDGDSGIIVVRSTHHLLIDDNSGTIILRSPQSPLYSSPHSSRLSLSDAYDQSISPISPLTRPDDQDVAISLSSDSPSIDDSTDERQSYQMNDTAIFTPAFLPLSDAQSPEVADSAQTNIAFGNSTLRSLDDQSHNPEETEVIVKPINDIGPSRTSRYREPNVRDDALSEDSDGDLEHETYQLNQGRAEYSDVPEEYTEDPKATRKRKNTDPHIGIDELAREDNSASSTYIPSGKDKTKRRKSDRQDNIEAKSPVVRSTLKSVSVPQKRSSSQIEIYEDDQPEEPKIKQRKSTRRTRGKRTTSGGHIRNMR